MKLGVSGIAGFIGSNLAARLVELGHEVVGIDNLWLGREHNVPEGVELHYADVRHFDRVQKAFKGCEAIFHQAAASSVTMYAKDPEYFWTTNVDGFHNVLLAAQENNAPVIYASSSSLYNGWLPPHKEGMAPNLKTHYELSMYARERLAALSKVPTVGLRYFSVYGPNEEHKTQFANLVSQFIWAMGLGQRPKIYNAGQQTRDFTYVEDVVEANILALGHLQRTKVYSPGEVYNVGTGVETTVLAMAAKVADAMGYGFNVEFADNPITDYVERVQSDTSAAKRALGFTADYPLEEGIKLLVEKFKQKTEAQTK